MRTTPQIYMIFSGAKYFLCHQTKANRIFSKFQPLEGLIEENRRLRAEILMEEASFSPSQTPEEMLKSLLRLHQDEVRNHESTEFPQSSLSASGVFLYHNFWPP